MSEDGDAELLRLRRRVARDAELIDELRDRLARSDRERLAAEADRAAMAALIARLREEADLRETELAEVQSRLAASEVELDDLRAVRDALTPAVLPERPGLEFAVSFVAAAQGVSGDFYLAAPAEGDTTMVVVGDVVGKGIEAARDAAFLRAAFATIARFSSEPCRLLGWANAAFRARVRRAGHFATAACLTYDPATRGLRWALAGHPTPLHLGTGQELGVKRRGAPLGVGDTVRCAEAACELAAGEGVLLYTDGLTEARRDGRLFGAERVQAVIRALRGRSGAEIVARLRDDATAFCGGRLADDLCLVALTGT